MPQLLMANGNVGGAGMVSKPAACMCARRVTPVLLCTALSSSAGGKSPSAARLPM